jgi:hypothetical protein
MDNGLSIGAIAIFAFIATLQDNEYGIQLFLTRNKHRRTFLGKLDERQLATRRRIFEKSYALLASLTFFSAFTLPTIFAQGLSTEGTYIIVFNVAIFVLGQP